MRFAALALVAAAAGTVPAAAQVAPAAAPTALFPRADYGFSFAKLHSADIRFKWVGHIGFDLDVVDYGSGRLRFAGGYEATIGRERRPYDLNQGFYSFDVAASARRGATEISGVVRHVSRHLTDRDSPISISWNEAGARVEHRLDGLVIELEATKAMQQAFVDYVWLARGRASVRHPIDDRLEWIASAAGTVVGVNRAISDRERVCGGRIEGGVRVNGDKAVIEVFGGYERRIDAFPTDRFRVRYFTMGFRILDR